MASLATGIWGLVNGDPAQAQENQLGQLGGFETGIGEQGTTAAMNYDLGILSGDPTKTAQTLAPEIRLQQEGEQQAKNQLAEFGNRSGGTAAKAASLDSAGRGNIISLLGGLQQGAAANAGSLGTQDLNMASGNINDVAGLRTAEQQREQADVSGIAKGAGEIASSLFTGGASPAAEGASPSFGAGDLGTVSDSSQQSDIFGGGSIMGSEGMDMFGVPTRY